MPDCMTSSEERIYSTWIFGTYASWMKMHRKGLVMILCHTLPRLAEEKSVSRAHTLLMPSTLVMWVDSKRYPQSSYYILTQSSHSVYSLLGMLMYVVLRWFSMDKPVAEPFMRSKLPNYGKLCQWTGLKEANVDHIHLSRRSPRRGTYLRLLRVQRGRERGKRRRNGSGRA